uniref:Uncharacterized protein n=1 Tax=Kalanchoe fedtschenkoi TaxID=63787 RepID=A0A7N0TW11_KALFE
MTGQIHRTSSIENEPRTLHINQIEYARKAALYVLNTRSVEEALRIFTDGLEPVKKLSMREEEEEDVRHDGEEWDISSIGCLHHHMHGIGRSTSSSSSSSSSGFRDIVTAPF